MIASTALDVGVFAVGCCLLLALHAFILWIMDRSDG